MRWRHRTTFSGEVKRLNFAEAVANLCYRRGLLVLECGEKAVRFSPPLILTRAQADAAVEIFSAACAEVKQGA